MKFAIFSRRRHALDAPTASSVTIISSGDGQLMTVRDYPQCVSWLHSLFILFLADELLKFDLISVHFKKCVNLDPQRPAGPIADCQGESSGEPFVTWNRALFNVNDETSNSSAQSIDQPKRALFIHRNIPLALLSYATETHSILIAHALRLQANALLTSHNNSSSQRDTQHTPTHTSIAYSTLRSISRLVCPADLHLPLTIVVCP